MVITHDMNLAAAFADKALMLKDGRVFASGDTDEVLTAGNVSEVFGVSVIVDADPASGRRRLTADYLQQAGAREPRR